MKTKTLVTHLDATLKRLEATQHVLRHCQGTLAYLRAFGGRKDEEESEARLRKELRKTRRNEEYARKKLAAVELDYEHLCRGDILALPLSKRLESILAKAYPEDRDGMIGRLVAMTDQELRAIPGMGKTSLKELRECLKHFMPTR